MRVVQQGIGHTWRDLTDEELSAQNGDLSTAKRDASGAIDREDLPSWTKTRVCTRCGYHSPDYLDPGLPNCDLLLIQGIHES